jgi:hypothetical protein
VIRPLLALAAGIVLAGCASSDACPAMCDAARDRFAACLEESGLEWGASVGYEDANDYDNWCGTYTWELRQLGEADSCAERLPVFTDGTCDDYYDAWDDGDDGEDR